MSVGNCFQVSIVFTSRDRALQWQRPFSRRENIRLVAEKRTIIFGISLSPSLSRRCRSTSIVCKAREAMNEVQVVTDSNWNKLVIGSENPVLVEFWAPWCGPCRMIAPVVDELAKEYAGKILCFKLNTDDCPAIATQYGIRSIPTVLFFKNGERKESIIGAVPKSTLTAAIEKYLEI